MKNNFENLLSSLFSFFILIAILGGGIIFLLFLVALLLGGETGANLAISTSTTIMPYFIKSATIAVLAGLVSMYARGMHTLTLQRSSKKDQ